MTDHIAIRHRWLRGELQRMVTAYEDFATRGDQSEMPLQRDAEIYKCVAERVEHLLNNRDLQGEPVPKIGEPCKISEDTPTREDTVKMATDIPEMHDVVDRLQAQLLVAMDLVERQMVLLQQHQAILKEDPKAETNAHDLGWTLGSLCQTQTNLIEAIREAMGARVKYTC